MRKIFLTLLICLIIAVCAATLFACNNDTNEETLPPESIPESAIVVTENGVKSGNLDAAEANADAINELISTADENAVIYFPRGTYFIGKTIKISGKKNLTLMGGGQGKSGALLVNSAYDNSSLDNSAASITVSCSNSVNVTIEGLNFDYRDYVQACGTIVGRGEKGTLIELEEGYLSGVKPALDGTEKVLATNLLNENSASLSETYLLTPLNITVVDNKHISFPTLWSNSINKKIVLRFTMWGYASQTFDIQNTDGFTLKSVNSYSAPGPTVCSPAGNANLTFDNFNILPDGVSGQLWGTNVDAIHIKGMRGELKLSDCGFKGLGDDALNIHSSAAIVDNLEASQNKARMMSGWSFKNGGTDSASADWCAVGDTVEFFDQELMSKGTAIVSAYNEGYAIFDKIPDSVVEGDIVQCLAYLPSVHIDGCTVDGGRARGFLIQTEDVLIENCTIKNLSLAGIIVSPDITDWYEMGPSDNVTIKNNKFENLCVTADKRCYGAIIVKAQHDGGGDNFRAGVHTNMLIQCNEFKNITASALYISATKGLSIVSNKVENFSTKPSTLIPSAEYAFALVNCDNVSLADNTGVGDSIYKSNVNFAS